MKCCEHLMQFKDINKQYPFLIVFGLITTILTLLFVSHDVKIISISRTIDFNVRYRNYFRHLAFHLDDFQMKTGISRWETAATVTTTR